MRKLPKYPRYNKQRDGNPFAWILSAAEGMRAAQRASMPNFGSGKQKKRE